MTDSEDAAELMKFKARLERLRTDAGKPRASDLNMPAATYHNLLDPKISSCPNWETVEKFVAGCIRYVARNRKPALACDVNKWKLAYDELEITLRRRRSERQRRPTRQPAPPQSSPRPASAPQLPDCTTPDSGEPLVRPTERLSCTAAMNRNVVAELDQEERLQREPRLWGEPYRRAPDMPTDRLSCTEGMNPHVVAELDQEERLQREPRLWGEPYRRDPDIS